MDNLWFIKLGKNFDFKWKKFKFRYYIIISIICSLNDSNGEIVICIEFFFMLRRLDN